MSNPNDLVSELKNLQSKLLKEPTEPELKEANQIAEELLDITKRTYDAICREYAITRGNEPHELDKKALEKYNKEMFS